MCNANGISVYPEVFMGIDASTTPQVVQFETLFDADQGLKALPVGSMTYIVMSSSEADTQSQNLAQGGFLLWKKLSF